MCSVILKAAFFDVGDTLVERWPPADIAKGLTRARICAELGEASWLDDFLDVDLGPRRPKMPVAALAEWSRAGRRFAPDDLRQETLRWFSEWFAERGIEMGPADIDRLRSLMCVPLSDVTSPVPGAFNAIRWCVRQGLRVILVTNTQSHTDADVLEDFRRFGLLDAIHAVASSHSVGWRKPHPAIFEHALRLAQAEPYEVFHVGDNLILDVFGARQLGIRAIWRRLPRPAAPIKSGRTALGQGGLNGRTSCGHPSECLFLDEGVISCVLCGEVVRLNVRPDAVIDDLTELEPIVARWIGA
jgi:FMN phosphatase YigB (HAD superfamily)